MLRVFFLCSQMRFPTSLTPMLSSRLCAGVFARRETCRNVLSLHTSDYSFTIRSPCLPRNVSIGSGACRAQIRGKKTKASIKLDELPQGVIPLESLPYEEDAPAYPTVVQQARSNMRKFENCVLLTRVGGFYELYFEHADEYGPLLSLKIAKKRTIPGPVSMVVASPTLLIKR